MSDVAIRVDNVSKRFRIGSHRDGYKTLRAALTEGVMRPWRRRDVSSDETIWALQGVSFEVEHGEVVGIIGRNGAGKSTLLKILSRITDPSEGKVVLHGRVGSLLEVGTGFHPELTGRENIYLSGSIMGMSKKEIDRKFDEIVAFSEVERFVDTMVKRYSSGMYLRLAFAVAAHLDPEILLVDEVLAVGDAAFQSKCLGKMGEVAHAGRTVLFVSHNLGAIARLCPRTLWLDAGRLREDALSPSVVHDYLAEIRSSGEQWVRPEPASVGLDFAFTTIRTVDGSGHLRGVFSADQEIVVEISYSVGRELPACSISARVCNADGVVVFTTSDGDRSRVSALRKVSGQYCSRVVIPGDFLTPGSYYLQIAAHVPMRHLYESVDAGVAFDVSASGSLASLDGRLGVVAPLLRWETEVIQ